MIKDKGILKAIWIGMFILCAVLGFLGPQEGGAKVLLVIFSFLFFVPAFADAWFSLQRKDAKELRFLRNVSLLSLGGTLVLLVASMLSVLGKSLILGDILHYALVVVSTPFVCGQYSVYSLLLWAVLLWCCIAALRKIKK